MEKKQDSAMLDCKCQTNRNTLDKEKAETWEESGEHRRNEFSRSSMKNCTPEQRAVCSHRAMRLTGNRSILLNVDRYFTCLKINCLYLKKYISSEKDTNYNTLEGISFVGIAQR